MTPHLYLVGVSEVARLTARATQGSGPNDPIAKDDGRSGGITAALSVIRPSVGSALVRAGEVIAGSGRVEPISGASSISTGCHSGT